MTLTEAHAFLRAGLAKPVPLVWRKQAEPYRAALKAVLDELDGRL